MRTPHLPSVLWVLTTASRRYIHTMAPNIREKFARGVNPFDFKGKNSFIRPLDRGISKLNDRGPCVVMASPGFLTNGASRELLEKMGAGPAQRVDHHRVLGRGSHGEGERIFRGEGRSELY